MDTYDHKKLDKKWQEKWEADKLYKTPVKPKNKKYVLDMFPYPSGAGLHVGHPEGYTATDIYSRFLRMNGFDVLHPMGWDAFGLPAENYAIKAGIPPAESTAQNIERFREQIKSIGLSYDWAKEINTSDPSYYKWTQWLFLQLYKHGLAYKKAAYVNWCPKDQTVLANEQVVDGGCERCGTKVVQKLLSQWFFKITDYSEKLLSGLGQLDWPEPIKAMQRNWIGKSEGAEIDFPLDANFNYVFIHGFSGSSRSDFWPWLTDELEKRKIKFTIFDLSNAGQPEESEQVGFVLRNAPFDDKTVIVGHSLGTVVGLKVIEKLKHSIAGYVSLAGFLVPRFKDHPRLFEGTFKWTFDFDKIQANTNFRKIIVDLKDDVIPEDQGKLMAEKLSGELIEVTAEGSHFHARKEPEILRNILPNIKVFTTRPDTLFGATYMVLAPEHPLVDQITTKEQSRFVARYVAEAKEKSELQRTALEKDKTGVFTGAFAINPATNEKIPVWTADYVLATYGTGAIMAVPAHDERDLEFAKKYKLPVKEVINQSGQLVDSGEYTGMSAVEAKTRIARVFGAQKVRYKLRDWLVSRQRYWGAPIPIIYCDVCGMQPVSEKNLPVELPTDVDFKPTGESPIARSQSFHNAKCPNCGKPAKRDADTMDTFVDSSWYYYRFTDPDNKKEWADKKKVQSWLPVDVYVGGAEHAVLHLLYARFITQALKDFGLVEFEEPFLKLRNQGLILGPDGEKMSKSRGNVINPDEVIEKFGADTFRMYEMFMGPLEDAKPWNTQGMIGIRRFLDKVWRVQISETAENTPATHKLIKKITSDIENFKFNTAIAAFMEFLNDHKQPSKSDWETFVILLAPFAPHITEELWGGLGNNDSIHTQVWPKYNDQLAAEEKVTIAVQVMGRLRATVVVAAGMPQDEIEHLVKQDPRVVTYLDGKTIRKTIFVPNKLINFVIDQS